MLLTPIGLFASARHPRAAGRRTATLLFGDGSNLRCECRSVGMTATEICLAGVPHAAPSRLLFLVPVALGLYRAPVVLRGRGNLRAEGELQAGGAGRPVLGDRRA